MVSPFDRAAAEHRDVFLDRSLSANNLTLEEVSRAVAGPFLSLDGDKATVKQSVVEAVLDVYSVRDDTRGLINGRFYALAALSFVDPSHCYHLEISNDTPTPVPVFYTIDLPIAPLTAPNTVSSSLRVELTDSNGDSSASVTPDFGALSILQRAFIVDPVDGVLLPTVDIGAPINAAGVYNFSSTPQAWINDPQANQLTVVVSFTLSPGDTANLQGMVVIDLGNGAPVCTIPALPTQLPATQGSDAHEIPVFSRAEIFLLCLAIALLGGVAMRQGVNHRACRQTIC